MLSIPGLVSSIKNKHFPHVSRRKQTTRVRHSALRRFSFDIPILCVETQSEARWQRQGNLELSFYSCRIKFEIGRRDQLGVKFIKMPFISYLETEDESEMTIPTRPAPPPPGRSQTISHHSAPAAVNKKPAPPRPPPPKALPSGPVKKSGSQKSISILSNLFGSKNSAKTSQTELRVPPKLPAPPAPKQHNFVPPSIPQPPPVTSDVQLINFDVSPTSSPTGIKKSNTGGSDSVSMDSFCSSTSSPNNLGAASQAER